MLQHPAFDPVAIHLGPIAIHWYGLMYLLAFGFVLWLGRKRFAIEPFASKKWNGARLDDLMFYGVLGVILGGRIGYMLFYKPHVLLAQPLDLFKVWQGGMSFHGGLIGVIVAMLLFARKHQLSLFHVTDLIAPIVPLGLAAGRLGNFINGELWGRTTDVAWAMVFPQAQDNLPRHPSQLYQMGLEGLLLFALLWWFARKSRPVGSISGLFLFGYGCARFFVEFYREPDHYLGTLQLGLSMGQWLSLPMIVLGLGLTLWAYRRDAKRQ